jgi:hypothetical protein
LETFIGPVCPSLMTDPTYNSLNPSPITVLDGHYSHRWEEVVYVVQFMNSHPNNEHTIYLPMNSTSSNFRGTFLFYP